MREILLQVIDKRPNFTATFTSDLWLLHFIHSHRTHSVTINLGTVVVIESNSTTILATLLITTWLPL